MASSCWMPAAWRVALPREKSTSRWVWCFSGTLLAAPWPPATFWPDLLWTDGSLVPVLPIFLAPGNDPRAKRPRGEDVRGWKWG